MNAESLSVLKSIFNTLGIQKLIDGDLGLLLDARQVLLCESKNPTPNLNTVHGIYEAAFQALCTHHRYEYVYKSLLFKRIILGAHSTRTASMLQEFRLGSSKVDAFVVNGICTSYEVKTEFDNFDRLERQVDDYLKYSDEVYVIGAKSNAEALARRLPELVGVKYLNRKGYFSTVRSAVRLSPVYSAQTAASLLTASELKRIARKFTSDVDDWPNTEVVRSSRDVLENINSEQTKHLVLNELRNRGVRKSEFLDSIPFMLSGKISQLNLSKKKQAGLIKRLGQSI